MQRPPIENVKLTSCRFAVVGRRRHLWRNANVNRVGKTEENEQKEKEKEMRKTDKKRKQKRNGEEEGKGRRNVS